MPRPNKGRNDRPPFPVRLSAGERGDLDAKAQTERVDRATLLRRALAAYQAVPVKRVSVIEGDESFDW